MVATLIAHVKIEGDQIISIQILLQIAIYWTKSNIPNQQHHKTLNLSSYHTFYGDHSLWIFVLALCQFTIWIGGLFFPAFLDITGSMYQGQDLLKKKKDLWHIYNRQECPLSESYW